MEGVLTSSVFWPWHSLTSLPSTTGGGSAKQVTVKTPNKLAAAANVDGALVILVQGNISGAAKVQVGSNKSIIGKAGSSLTGIGLTILNQKNSKGSLVGRSDKDAAEDAGKLHVIYANNYFNNVWSCGPLLRFDTAYIINQYYNTMDMGLNSRMGAQALIQSSVFTNVGKKAIFSESSAEIGYVVAEDVIFSGESQNTAAKGILTLSKIPYKFILLGSGRVTSTVPRDTGQKLSF
ncbi:hypothetical protein ACHAP7_005988 [Fusarium lateritium]